MADSAASRRRFGLRWGLGNVLHFCAPQDEADAADLATRGADLAGSTDMDVQDMAQEAGNGAAAAGRGGNIVRVSFVSMDVESRRLALDAMPLYEQLLLQKGEAGGGNSLQLLNDWAGAMANVIAPLGSRDWDDVTSQAQDFPQHPISNLDNDNKINNQSNHNRQVLRLVWDLLRLLFLDPSAALLGVSPLLHWLKLSDGWLPGQGNSAAAKIAGFKSKARMMATAAVEDMDEYWSSVASCVAIGWTSAAVALLRMHSAYHSDDAMDREHESGMVEAVAVLISQMPRLEAINENEDGDFSSFSEPSVPIFFGRREEWRSKVALFESSPYWTTVEHRKTAAQLRGVLRIMSGNRDAMKEAVGCHWLELAVARLLHSTPHLGCDSWASAARTSWQAVIGREQATEGQVAGGGTSLDRLLLAILERDTQVIISQTSRLFDSWMVAHVAEVLSARDSSARDLSQSTFVEAGGANGTVLSAPRQTLGGSSLSDAFRLNFAMDVLSHHATWQICLPYLAASGPAGADLLPAVVVHAGARDGKGARQALQLAATYGLSDEAASSICLNEAVRRWEAREVGASLEWMLAGTKLLTSSSTASSSSWKQLSILEGMVAQLMPAALDATNFAAAESTGSNGLGGVSLSFEDLDLVFSNSSFSAEDCLPQQGPLLLLLRTWQLGCALKKMGVSMESGKVVEWDESAARDATEALLQILHHPGAPSTFFASLLSKLDAILDFPGRPLLSAVQTQEIITTVEAFCVGLKNNSLTASPNSIRRIQMKLAQNLSRCFLAGA